jgi:hypothetical protein
MSTQEDRRLRAERCRERATRVSFPPLRSALLEIADQYDMEAALVERSLQAIIESKHLLNAADRLLHH